MDAELLTLAVMQALLGYTSEARWLRYARMNLVAIFPHLPQQPGYNKRLCKLAETMRWLTGVLGHAHRHLHLHAVLFEKTDSGGGAFKASDNLVLDRSPDGTIEVWFVSIWVRDYVLHHADFVFRIADIRAALPGVSDQTFRLALDALKVDSMTADGVGLGSVWRRSVGTCQNCNVNYVRRMTLPCTRRNAPRARDARIRATITPTMKSPRAMTPASHGFNRATITTLATAASSVNETATLLTGSGGVFTASLVVALARCVRSATVPPAAAMKAVGRSTVGVAMTTAKRAPTAGRITVLRASHPESSHMILSATASTTTRNPRASSTSTRSRPIGTSKEVTRPRMPNMKTRRYGFRPLAQEAVKARGIATSIAQLCRPLKARTYGVS